MAKAATKTSPKTEAAPATKTAKATPTVETRAETTTEAAPAPAEGGKGLSRPMRASAALAAIIGDEPMPRTAVVAKVWEHIRAGDLQDPKDKRTIVADDKLKAVFGKDRVTMFEMQKLLSPHLSAV